MSRKTQIIISIIISVIIVVISLIISFGWKIDQPKPPEGELPQGEEIIPGEERITPTGGGERGISAPKAIPCLVLDEEYCDKGESIYDKDGKLVGLGFNLPKGTKIYAPFGGVIDNSFAAEILDGFYYGFEILERGQQDQRNHFDVVGEVKTTIKPEQPVFPEDPERLANEPVQKGQCVAEATEGQHRRIITDTGNYDIVIYFMTYDTAKSIWSYNLELFQQFFPYIKEQYTACENKQK